MRSLRVNRRTFWYALYEGDEPVRDINGYPTGDYTKTYGTPKKFRANVSAANGNYAEYTQGMLKDYERTIYTHRLDLGITEDTLVWYGKTPAEGEANYIVTRVVDGLHGFFYELRQVDVR